MKRGFTEQQYCEVAVRIFFSMLLAVIQETPVYLESRKAEIPPFSEVVR